MIRVAVAADIRLYRDGLIHALSARPDVHVVGNATSADEMLAVARELRPDILLVDTSMPKSLSRIQIIARELPLVKIVALALEDDEDAVVAFAEAGTAGLVSRDASLDDLIATIQSTVRGELLCSPRTAGTLLRRLVVRAGSRQTLNGRLTARELQILKLVGDGLSNKEIAARLSVEVTTVKNHVHNILEKMRVHRRGEAVAQLRESGT